MSKMKTYLNLIPQLNTVVIEVSYIKVLGQRGNPQKLYRAKHLPSQNGTYAWRHRGLLEDLLNHFIDDTNFILTCSSGALHKALLTS